MAVSEAMVNLRRMQGAFNGFWQTSDLAYRYLLSHSNELAHVPWRPTVSVLGHLESEVWFPSNQGNLKRTDTICQTLEQVNDNAVHVFRATLLSFYSAFEDYLETRVAPLTGWPKRWGPFVQSLKAIEVAKGGRNLRLRTIICADLCRLIRNKMIHENFAVPTTLVEIYFDEWCEKLVRQCQNAGWEEKPSEVAVNAAIKQVFGQAVRQVEDAKGEGKTLPIEYFYMLFAFTNLDSLAFAIEEAVTPEGELPPGRVKRRRDAVHRKDLIVRAPPGAD